MCISLASVSWILAFWKQMGTPRSVLHLTPRTIPESDVFLVYILQTIHTIHCCFFRDEDGSRQQDVWLIHGVKICPLPIRILSCTSKLRTFLGFCRSVRSLLRTLLLQARRLWIPSLSQMDHNSHTCFLYSRDVLMSFPFPALFVLVDLFHIYSFCVFLGVKGNDSCG